MTTKIRKNPEDETRCSVVMHINELPGFVPKDPFQKTAYCPNQAEFIMSCEGLKSMVCAEHKDKLNYPRFKLNSDVVETPKFQPLSGWLFN